MSLLLVATTLGLWGIILIAGYGWGRFLSHGLRATDLSVPFSLWLGAGLGTLAWGIGLLGFVPRGWQPGTLALALLSGLVIAWNQRQTLLRLAWPPFLRSPSSPMRLGILLAATVLLVSWLWAWMPPWSYDALMYHLDGPRLLLAHGHWVLLPQVWTFNSSYLLPMLFLVGLAFGNDIVSKLIAWTFGLLLLLLIADWGYRLFQRAEAAVWNAIWLLSIPIFGTWMHWAYVDIAWTFFLVGSAYALWNWRQQTNRNPAWLRLSGWLLGLALLTKLLAAGALAMLAFTLLWDINRKRAPRIAWFQWGLGLFLLPLPMLAKNWALSGNPFYPFFFGGPGAPTSLRAAFRAYMHSYGWGRGLLRYLVWPLGIYTHYRSYTTFWGKIEYPPPLGWITYLWPWRHHSPHTRDIALWALGWTVAWSLSSQQIRFLLPSLALSALLLTDVFLRLLSDTPRWIWRLAWLSTGSALAFTLLPGIYLRPWLWWTGHETREQILERVVPNYAAWQFIQKHISPQESVLSLWNWQGYYCDERCKPDVTQHLWSWWVYEAGDAETLLQRLRGQGITHLLYSGQDLRFLLNHDPWGWQRAAYRFLAQDFAPRCTTVVRQWPQQDVILYRLRAHCLSAP